MGGVNSQKAIHSPGPAIVKTSLTITSDVNLVTVLRILIKLAPDTWIVFFTDCLYVKSRPVQRFMPKASILNKLFKLSLSLMTTF